MGDVMRSSSLLQGQYLPGSGFAVSSASDCETLPFDELVDEVIAILDDFRGEESVKELFWAALSYDPVDDAASCASYLSPRCAQQLSGMRIFAKHGSVTVILLESETVFSRWDFENVCRQLQRHFAWLVILFWNTSSDQWSVIVPDDTKKQYLRVIVMPGASTERAKTARALAALTAFDPATNQSVNSLDLADNLETLFPGAAPRLSDYKPFGFSVGRLPTYLQSIEPFLHETAHFPLLTFHQERGQDLSGEECPPDGSLMDYQRWRLVTHNIRLVIYCACRFRFGAMPLEDLVQEGCLGLIEAVSRFDPRRNCRFSTYAYNWIRQKMFRSVEADVNTIRWPYHKSAELIERNRTGQTEGLKPGERAVESLPGRRQPLLSELQIEPSPYERVVAQEKSRLVRKALDGLDERVAMALKLRYGVSCGKEHTLQEIGEHLGLTRERARQIIETGLSDLKPRLSFLLYDDY